MLGRNPQAWSNFGNCHFHAKMVQNGAIMVNGYNGQK